MFHEEPTALALFFTSLPLLLLITSMTMTIITGKVLERRSLYCGAEYVYYFS